MSEELVELVVLAMGWPAMVVMWALAELVESAV